MSTVGLTVGLPTTIPLPTTGWPGTYFPAPWPQYIPANPWYHPKRCPGWGRCRECGR